MRSPTKYAAAAPPPALLVPQLRVAVQAFPDSLLEIRNRSIGLMHFAANQDVEGEPFVAASHYRDDLFDCLTAREDELFELVDALLCADGPVRAPVDLTLVAEHRRGHGAMYDALNSGNVDVPPAAAGACRPAHAAGRRRAPGPRGRHQPLAPPGRPDQR